VIPQEVRNKLRLRPGDDFIVLYSETGDILLRPIRTKNGRGLIKGLQALRGLKLDERTPWDEPVRDISL
jgi:AbrB family looped-hinge helix DNA binding protein